MRTGILLTGLIATIAVAVRDREPAPEPRTAPLAASLGDSEATRLRAELSAARQELEAANARLERWHRIFAFANRYNISSDLAGSIYDIASAEGIEPELAFRVVKLESDFKERARSSVGAIGLTQLMLPTARYFQKNVTREELYDRETNLRIGFRYLRGLIKEYKTVNLALLVYNRGPAAVLAAREEGVDPSNGYDRIILRGYTGDGVIE
ncbi:MAG TPA: transglycosylase SLT domain-containing protein [Gemmatimonadaceae bacterium]|nr:transglycosylase SLT domain-containing protein [Gemmatimonadaceae bacterium]